LNKEIIVMEGQWTTVGKRTSNKVAPLIVEKSPEFIESVRTNQVYSKHQFTSGLTAHRTTEPVYAKGSVFSSRLRNEVEQIRSTTSERITSPVIETRNTTEFQLRPSPYKNAAIKGLDKEKLRNDMVAAARAKAYTADVFPVGIPIRFKPLRPQTVPVEEEPQYDEGFDDSDTVVHIRRKRIQPTEKFQTISHVTTIHKSAIDIIEPDDTEVTEFSEPHESNYE
jgi:hypothetical protein